VQLELPRQRQPEPGTVGVGTRTGGRAHLHKAAALRPARSLQRGRASQRRCGAGSARALLADLYVRKRLPGPVAAELGAIGAAPGALDLVGDVAAQIVDLGRHVGVGRDFRYTPNPTLWSLVLLLNDAIR
jgi:hypothetical protein